MLITPNAGNNQRRFPQGRLCLVKINLIADKVKTALLLDVCVNWLCWVFLVFGKTVKNEDATPLFLLSIHLFAYVPYYPSPTTAYSITNGIGAGFVSYTFIKLVRRKGGEVHWMMYLVSFCFIVYFSLDWLKKVLGF